MNDKLWEEITELVSVIEKQMQKVWEEKEHDRQALYHHEETNPDILERDELLML